MTLRTHAHAIYAADEGVERAGTGKAPTAFRIWRAGENIADDGSIFFTEESAAALLERQASRAVPYSIDFDHLSLSTDRPATAGRAAGYHVLEVRRDAEGSPELWATNLEWTEDVRAGLEQEPPLWRYFSPAFHVDGEAKVTSYVNLALCINPMTHGIPLLASQKPATVQHASRSPNTEAGMSAEEMLAALDAMIEATEDANQKAALVAAREALASKKDVDSDGTEEEVVADAKGDDDEDEDKKAAASDEETKKESSTKAHAAKLDPIAALTREVMELRRKNEVREIDDLLAGHKGLPEAFKTHCRSQSYDNAKAMISAMPRLHSAKRNESAAQTSSNAGDAMDPRDADAMDRAMGVKSATAIMPHKLPDGRFQMHNVRPSDLTRMNAQKAKA